jgi:hypothetical protein
MIAYSSNGKQIMDAIKMDIQKKLSVEESDKLLRTIASTLTGVMRDRVHVQGKDSNEQQIGTYSPEYMKVRTGDFGNSDRFSKGKNKGKAKNAGVYTKYGVNVGGRKYFINIADKGIQRQKYNRSADTKVILSLTRQMENDMSVCEKNPIKIPYGYAIGYQNDFNYDKLLWCEETYKKKILTKLSKNEEILVDEIVKNYVGATN